MKKLTVLFCVLYSAVFALAAADRPVLDTAAFLARVRHPTGQQNYARLYGTVSHLRRGGETVELPIYLGIMLTADRRLSQVIVDNREGYRIGQSYTSGEEGTTVTPLKEGGYKDSQLGKFGLRPEDLSMAFLYWPLERELAPTTFRTADCRVLLLKNPENNEAAKVSIAADYFFPVKVEFFEKISDLSKPVRTMEVERFKETANGFWVPTQLKLQGPGWRTKVEFTEAEAAELDPKNPPANVFRSIK